MLPLIDKQKNAYISYLSPHLFRNLLKNSERPWRNCVMHWTVFSMRLTLPWTQSCRKKQSGAKPSRSRDVARIWRQKNVSGTLPSGQSIDSETYRSDPNIMNESPKDSVGDSLKKSQSLHVSTSRQLSLASSSGKNG